MSRKNDPRTEGKRKDQNTNTKGGKNTMTKDTTDKLDSKAAQEDKTCKTPTPSQATKAPKANKAQKANKAKKAKKAALPEGLPEMARPRQMYKCRSFENGKWRWRGPYKRISKAKQVVYGDLDKIEIVQVWYDPDRDLVLRYLTPEELDRYHSYPVQG